MATPIQPTSLSEEFEVVGLPKTPFADAYHLFLRVPLWQSIAMIVLAYLALNGVFAVLFWLTGGLANSEGTLLEAFFFSVQTMGTIGYGSMYPTSTLANALVTGEAVIGMLVTAISTGLVFAKISQPGARIAFSDKASLGPMDGIPTLQFRIGNERGNIVMNTQLTVAFVRTETTAEGMTFYRMHELPLVRQRAPTLTRTWTVMHRITPDSPLWGATPESLIAEEAELMVTVVGTDDTTLQPVFAGARYRAQEIAFGMRPADVITELPDGRVRIDLGRFHHVTPVGEVSWQA